MLEETHSLTERIAQLAHAQYGVVSRKQLLAAGMSSSSVAAWVRSAHLHSLHRGVYAVGHRRIGREGAWLAAILACPSGSALSYGSAGQHRGIISRRERLAIHVSVPGTAPLALPAVVTHVSRNLDPRDVTRHLGIPTTTGTRTVWDLATVLSPTGLRRAFEQAEKLRVLDRERLRALLTASPSRKGAGLIRQLLAETALPLEETRSRLEELILELCRDEGLPLPAVNVPLLGWEVDFLWERERFVVEADGGDHLSRRQRDRDNERDAELGRAGFLVRRYGWVPVRGRREVATEIAAILAERGG